MSDCPKVKVHGCSVDENTFTDGEKVWVVTNLIEKAKDLEPFDLPVAGIYSGSAVWSLTGSAYGVAAHARRALDVNTTYPVILDEEGFIMDGWHRVLRALIDGATTIKAVRFDKTPQPDYMNKKD
jgi:hypothetical protein